MVTTYAPAAFDETGAYNNASDAVMVDIAAVMTTSYPLLDHRRGSPEAGVNG